MLRLYRKREKYRLKRLRKQRKARKSKEETSTNSKIIEYYATRTQVKAAKRSHSYRILNFPKNFSIFDNADRVLGVYREMVSFCLKPSTKQLSVLQEHCAYVGHGAESVLNALGKAAHRDLRISFRGSFPRDKEQKDIVFATGLPRYLGIDLPSPNNFTTFELKHGKKRKDSALKSSYREEVVDELIEYLNKCLNQYNYTLSSRSELWLGNLLGEVLGNAEDHGGRPDWWIAGYLRELPNHSYGDCHITIFNFGSTIYETLQDLPTTSLLRQHINSLVDIHKRKSFFRRGWTEENLWTLYALQEGVSRFNINPCAIGTRGHGLADMIEFFQKLGSSKQSISPPRMCLISGHTQVIFSEAYKIQKVSTGEGTTRRVLAFNNANDLSQPPNPEYVRELDEFFPGTLISMDFFLDPGNLQELGGDVCRQLV